MRYKIVKKTYIYNGKLNYKYDIMYEKKLWWKKTPVWRECWEHDRKVSKDTIQEAEEYISIQIRKNNGDFDPEDIKIYECRDSKLNKILNQEC